MFDVSTLDATQLRALSTAVELRQASLREETMEELLVICIAESDVRWFRQAQYAECVTTFYELCLEEHEKGLVSTAAILLIEYPKTAVERLLARR